jgi:hypothetical protein
VYRYSQDGCISCFVLLVLVCHQIHFLWHFVCLSEWWLCLDLYQHKKCL